MTLFRVRAHESESRLPGPSVATPIYVYFMWCDAV